MDRKRLTTSFVIAAVISFIVLLLLNDFGITWDEPTYMVSGDMYVAWMKKPELTKKDNVFRATLDLHPPLRKILTGITHEVLTQRLRILDNTRGYRISSLLFVFPFILVFSYIAIGQFGYLFGIVLPFMYSLLPHVLFLTPLVTLDYAIASLWFIAVVTGMKGVTSYKWLTISAVIVGLSLLTKLHGFLLFIPIAMYLFWYYRRTKRNVIKRLGYLIVIAFLFYVVGWPWLWTSPIAHVSEYFRIQLEHTSPSVYIFGQIYPHAPWWYTPLMFLTTTPVFVLVLFFIGATYAIFKGRTWDRLILMNALFPIVFFSLPWVYRYDWVRLFLACFPFVCLVAGRGIAVIISSLRPSLRSIGMIIILSAWMVTVYQSVIRIHPWESAYYNEIVGGIHGAYQMGFETDYWGNANLAILSWMNANKKDMMCVSPTTNPFYYYQAMGSLEPGVVFNAERDACKYIIISMRQGLFVRDPFVARIVQTQQPVYTVSIDDVPLVSVYNIEK